MEIISGGELWTYIYEHTTLLPRSVESCRGLLRATDRRPGERGSFASDAGPATR